MQLGLTAFADMSLDEYKTHALGYRCAQSCLAALPTFLNIATLQIEAGDDSLLSLPSRQYRFMQARTEGNWAGSRQELRLQVC